LESLAFSPFYIFHPHSMALIGAFAALLPGTIFAALCKNHWRLWPEPLRF